ncbi:MAG: nucleotidyltransferase domain-containing protein [Candidatus Margulisiibacteriota bacterium]
MVGSAKTRFACYNFGMKKIRHLFKKYPIQAVYLFGSRANDKAGTLSDYDFGVLLKENIPQPKYSDIKLKLTVDLVHGLKNDCVDVVILNDAPLLLKYEVIKNRKCLYNTNPAKTAMFLFSTLSLYFDWEHIQSKFSNSLINEVAKEGINA